MTHEHLQPFFSEPLSKYKIFRAKRVECGLVVTLARVGPMRPVPAWRIVLIPNGATYQEHNHAGCVVFTSNVYDPDESPDESSQWLQKVLSAPAQLSYRKLVHDVWQCFLRKGLGVVDAMATPTGIVAVTYGEDPTLLTLREVALDQSPVVPTMSDYQIGEYSVKRIPYPRLTASNCALGHEMYTYVISIISSFPNELMHLPTYRLESCALAYCMQKGETSQLIALIQQSTAINNLDITFRRRYHSTMEMAARCNRDGQVFHALLEKGALIWTDDDPYVGTMAEVVRKKNLDALHLLLSANQQSDTARWWDRFGASMCNASEFPGGADLFKVHLARRAALAMLAEISGHPLSPIAIG